MERITLFGGQIHITEDCTSVYQVLQGHVLVYLLPIEEQGYGRRQFLIECTEGEQIPSFYMKDALLGNFCIGLVALDKAELQKKENAITDDIILQFAQRLNLKISSVEEYPEQLTEIYQLNIVKEEAYIYATALEQKNVKESGLNVIYKLFQKEKSIKGFEESGNALYDAVAYLCRRSGIPYVSLEVLQSNCGRRFSLQDMARVSHFPVREIVLEEKWWRKAAGYILVFGEDQKTPYACFPAGRGKYRAYDPKTQKEVTVNDAFMEGKSLKAWTIYRPFPDKKMNMKDLIRFGIKDVYASDIVTLLVLTLVGTLIGLLIPYMNELLYDKYIPMAYRQGLIGLFMVILACNLGNLSFSIVKNLATFRSMNVMEYSVQSATYDRLMNLPESFLKKYDATQLAYRASGITTIFDTVADVLVRTFLSAVFSFFYLGRMFAYSAPMSLVSMVMLAVLILIIVVTAIRQVRLETERIHIDQEADSKSFQFINGISKIRIAGVEDRALYEYLKPYTRSRELNMEIGHMSIFVNSLNGISSVLFSIVFFYMMVNQSIPLSMGSFMAFTSAFGAFSGAMLEIATSLLSLNQVTPIYRDCKDILQTLPETSKESILPGNLTGEIEVSNVSFAYDEESGQILNNVSLHIQPGEYVGIVGSSGSGKSTLLKLLLGFEKPQKGKIYYDNKDIDSLDKRELRKKFGVVLQDGGLISGSIMENITITAPNTTLDRVKEVIEEVGLAEDIDQMPMGLNTVLAENSGTVSGGQKQRILIARALVNKPRIIFFDEATSALDNVTQAQVCDTLEKIQATKVVIAHRLSTIINCDRILVLEKGRIVEEGDFESLMEKKGIFYQLAARQMN